VTLSEQIRQAIEKANHVLVITHISPDGDAFGSLTAVGQVLSQWNKKFSLVCDDPPPNRFYYLPLVDTVLTKPKTDAYYDLIIAVDCGDQKRMGQAFACLSEPKPFVINIDHHVTNTEFGEINLINPVATSATEMLYELFAGWKIRLTADIALSLLTGLVTDTLGFRTDGVTANTLRIASSLVEAGADLQLVTMQGLKIKPLSTLRLWQLGLNNMKLENGLLWTSISNEDLKNIGYTNASSAGLVNILSDVYQAAMGVVLLEMDDGAVQVGFRCHPPYNVSELATNLGGGGHPLAAGCTLDGPLAKAESLVVQLSKEAIRQQMNGHR
jgi:phosphoesterase RecJ-like protein